MAEFKDQPAQVAGSFIWSSLTHATHTRNMPLFFTIRHFTIMLLTLTLSHTFFSKKDKLITCHRFDIHDISIHLD